MRNILFTIIAILIVLFFLASKIQACELNESPCQIQTKHGVATILLDPRPLKPMVESKLIVQGLNSLKEPKIHIYGISMYLGHLRENLEKNKNGDLEAEIIIAPCDEEEMLFSLEVLDGDEIIAQMNFTTFN